MHIADVVLVRGSSRRDIIENADLMTCGMFMSVHMPFCRGKIKFRFEMQSLKFGRTRWSKFGSSDG